MKIKKSKLFVFILCLVAICCLLGTVSAADVDNNVNDSVVTETNVNDTTINENVGERALDSQSQNNTVTKINDKNNLKLDTENKQEASNWSELYNKCSSEDDATIILTGNEYIPTSGIKFISNVNIIGTGGSYFTGTYNGTPFSSDDSSLTINFINVTFVNMNVENLLRLSGANTIENCNFINITTGTGRNSVIYNFQGNMSIINSNFINCSTGYGAITNYGTNVVMGIDNSKFINNSAAVEPGAINNCGILSVNNSEFRNNVATWWAGAIHTHYNSQTLINNSNFTNNNAGWNGGALYTYSKLNVYNSIFDSNTCNTSTGGGAIGASRWFMGNYNITIENCTFKENANLCNNGSGGAITAMNSGALNVHNSTFIANSADNGQAIAAYSQSFENISAGIPNLKVYDNTFINHTSTLTDTVSINGNYTFENNTFNNCYQTNIGTNNIFNNPISANTLVTSKNNNEINVSDNNILKDNNEDAVYVNVSSSNTNGDGKSWATAYGGSSVYVAMNHKGVVYLADGNYSRKKRGLDTQFNTTLIGQGPNTIWVNFPMALYYTEPTNLHTFINMTFLKGSFSINSRFINCTFRDGTFGFALNVKDDTSPEEYGIKCTRNFTFENCIFENVNSTLFMDSWSYSCINFTNCTFKNITADSIVNKSSPFVLDDGIYFEDCDFSDLNVKGIVGIPTDSLDYIGIKNCHYDFTATTDIISEEDKNISYVNATSLPKSDSKFSFNSDKNGNIIITLTGINGTTINNATIDYLINGDMVSTVLVTDENGNAQINNLTGSNNITVIYKGNDDYLGTNSSIYVVVAPKPERIATQIVSSDFNQTAVDYYKGERGGYFVVALKDSEGNALAGKHISIGFNGKVYNRTTDENGGARLQINLANAGVYTFATAFLGDDECNGSFVVNKITVTKKSSTITVKGTNPVKVRSYRTLTFNLKGVKAIDKSSYVNAIGRTLKVTVNGKTYTLKTDKNGKATLKVRFTKAGTYTIKTAFAGDGTFNAKTMNSKITVRK